MSPFNLRDLPTLPRGAGHGAAVMVRRLLAARSAPAWAPISVPSVRRACLAGIRLIEYRPPPPFPVSGGWRLAFFSDLHWSAADARRLGPTLIRLINRAQADWVLFGGDLVRCQADLAAALSVLHRIEARCGKLAVLGNWERRHAWVGLEQWREWFADGGFRLLVNEATSYGKTNGRVAPVFIGMDDARRGRGNVTDSPLPDPAPPLAVRLAHSPDSVAEAPPDNLGDLVLAGHTHGGQFRLPRFGALYTSSAYGKAFEYGWRRHIRSGTLLYTTRGVGCTGKPLLRRRIFCPPEIAIILLPGPEQATGNAACRLGTPRRGGPQP
ncbi:MAG: hypothetical protein GXP31_00010 [Kiritimatiellaeota bacterium]|nr:hypothetical protein [Kiritimatiellota bacterium]